MTRIVSDPAGQTAATGAPAPSSGVGYLAGLDGLRAISILAVIAYHLDASWAAGGYLGVEVFFVISGYLITLLALDEGARTGSLDRIRFWGRRARRLLPAVVVLVVGVLTWTGLVLPAGELSRFRGDALASLLYVQNWYAIVGEQAYFDVFGRPSPFRHLWSLAIEEQFYLVWPLVLPWLWRGRTDRTVIRILGAAAVVSAVLMASFVDITSPERAYYGTDTRAFGILAGAILAFAWRPQRARVDVVANARRTLATGGIFAIVLLGWQFANRSEFDTWTYPWGFLWVDLLTVVAIIAATHPASRFATQIGARPLAAIGRRSYSLYLWHWPVIVFTRPGVDWGHQGAGALVWRLLIIVALSEISYRFVEQPFRDGRALRAWDNLRIRSMREGWWAAAAVVATAVLAGGLNLVATASPAPDDTAGRPSAITIAPQPSAPASSTTAAPTTAVPTSAPAATAVLAVPVTPTTAAPTTTAPRPVPDVTIMGESVTLGGAHRLQEVYGQRLQMDAVEGRSFNDGVARLEEISAEGILTPYVIVHFGNNGAIPPGGLDRIVAAVGPERRLLFVSVRVPRNWESQVNGEIWDALQRHPNVGLIDWHRVANSEPGLLTDDGVHLSKAGEDRYAALMAEATP